ncbi:TolB family protein [Cryptosporangium phraense]|uniref:WD40 repeat domain-containing protein n=1 Tax=Cryptosporangium phraense TaxID=2593070 RepID=A0A545AR71_9ACTN|nr:hypothetical protein [Cryptosporangium phraense]TQS43840.1 hypothetical protein FL583_17605 [Cryptosporangium phraense]
MRLRPVFVVLVLSVVALLAATGIGFGAAFALRGDSGASRYASPRYPTDTDDLPLFTSDVSESAPGRSVFLLETVGMFSDSHVLFAADSDRVRGVDAITDRSDPEYDMVTTQLAPDGSRLAIGDATGDGTDVLVADLATGAERRFPVEAGPAGQIEVLAWSADATQLAVAAGSLYVLDVTSGRWTQIGTPDAPSEETSELLPGEEPLPDGEDPPALSSGSPDVYGEPGGVQAAFSPDGQSIVYDDGADIEVYPTDGSGSPVLLTDRAVRLAGPNAWSPDGRRVLVLRDESTDVDETTSLLAIDVRSKQADRVARFGYVEFSDPALVGWRGAGQVLLAGIDENGSEVVDAYGLDGKRGARVLTFGYSTFSVQVAAKLFEESTARGGGFSGGPTPTGWRVAVGVAAGVVAALGFSVIGAAVGVPLAVRRRAGRRAAAFGTAAFAPVAGPGGWSPPVGPAGLWPPPGGSAGQWPPPATALPPWMPPPPTSPAGPPHGVRPAAGPGAAGAAVASGAAAGAGFTLAARSRGAQSGAAPAGGGGLSSAALDGLGGAEPTAASEAAHPDSLAAGPAGSLPGRQAGSPFAGQTGAVPAGEGVGAGVEWVLPR